MKKNKTYFTVYILQFASSIIIFYKDLRFLDDNLSFSNFQQKTLMFLQKKLLYFPNYSFSINVLIFFCYKNLSFSTEIFHFKRNYIFTKIFHFTFNFLGKFSFSNKNLFFYFFIFCTNTRNIFYNNFLTHSPKS